MIFVFILPSNIIFRKTERVSESEIAPAHKERERKRKREREREEEERAHRRRPISLRLHQQPRDFAPRTHEPIFDFPGEPRAFDPPIFDPKPLNHEPSTSSATQSLRLRQNPMNQSLFLCDFDFCCCCGGVGSGVLVVFLLCGGGFCLLAVGYGI